MAIFALNSESVRKEKNILLESHNVRGAGSQDL